MKGYRYILPALFVLVLLVPIINDALGIWSFERTEENRTFHAKPALDINALDGFPKAYDQYYSDTFSLRTPLLDLYQQIKYSWFKVSPKPELTMIGNDGWFFMTKKETEILAGNWDFTDEQLLAFKHEWTNRTNFLDSLNIKYYWFSFPMKHYVYQDKLPYHAKVSERPKRVTQLQEYINGYFPDLLHDPSQMLLQARDSADVFYRLDNHWNHNAGYLVSEYILDVMRKDFPSLKLKPRNAYIWNEEEMLIGYHRKTIGIESLVETRWMPTDTNERALPFSYGFPPTRGFAYPEEYELSYRIQDTAGVRVLIIRDSFFDALKPFLKESFSESVFLFDAWRYGLNREVILQVRPDAVIFAGLETHIDHYIRDFSNEPK